MADVRELSTDPAIKSGSTAAVAADQAMVVAISPNSPAVPLNTTTSGTLTASDAVVGAPTGDGSLISGASTPGSIVASVVPDGTQAWTLFIKGYVSGAIYSEVSNNSTNGTDGDWVEVKGRRTGTAVGIESVVYTMIASGYYRGNAAGFKYIRARLIGGTGPTIIWVLSNGQGATFLNSGIPGGSSNIGTVNLGSGTNTLGAVKLTDGTYAAALDSHGQQQIDGIALQQLVRLGLEQVRQLTKISLILSAMSGTYIEDDDIDNLII